MSFASKVNKTVAFEQKICKCHSPINHYRFVRYFIGILYSLVLRQIILPLVLLLSNNHFFRNSSEL